MIGWVTQRYSDTIRAFDDYFAHASFKHNAYCYSQSTLGLGHPDGPVGIVCRDQGQADVFAGRSRLLLTTDGYGVMMSKALGFIAEEMHFHVKSISRFKIQGRTFDEKIFNGQKIAAIQPNRPENLIVCTESLQMDPETGVLISGYVPWDSVFDERKLFKSDNSWWPAFLSVDDRRFRFWSEKINGS